MKKIKTTFNTDKDIDKINNIFSNITVSDVNNIVKIKNDNIADATKFMYKKINIEPIIICTNYKKQIIQI